MEYIQSADQKRDKFLDIFSKKGIKSVFGLKTESELLWVRTNLAPGDISKKFLNRFTYYILQIHFKCTGKVKWGRQN